MFMRFAACLVLVLAVVGPAQARPFTAKDMATLDRVSDPHISPDGRFVAYNVRSTDWEANHGVNALWVLERGMAGSPPRLIRDEEKAATQPRWSADGSWLYFLSGRSGSVQVWRQQAGGAEARQMTNLPLDVSFYRIAPDGRDLVVAINVYPDCDTLACTKAKQDAKTKLKASGTVYESATPDSGTLTWMAATSICLPSS
jgi:dipeptidyl aminopeptidase/acylaminoacyl peptidase